MTARHIHLSIVDVDEVQESAAVFEWLQADAILKYDASSRVLVQDGVDFRLTPATVHLVELLSPHDVRRWR